MSSCQFSPSLHWPLARPSLRENASSILDIDHGHCHPSHQLVSAQIFRKRVRSFGRSGWWGGKYTQGNMIGLQWLWFERLSYGQMMEFVWKVLITESRMTIIWLKPEAHDQNFLPRDCNTWWTILSTSVIRIISLNYNTNLFEMCLSQKAWRQLYCGNWIDAYRTEAHW